MKNKQHKKSWYIAPLVFFQTLKTFIVRMGGWVSGDQKGPSIFLIFKYVTKKDALIPNLSSKVVYDNYIKSYEEFKFENFKF